MLHLVSVVPGPRDRPGRDHGLDLGDLGGRERPGERAEGVLELRELAALAKRRVSAS